MRLYTPLLFVFLVLGPSSVNGDADPNDSLYFLLPKGIQCRTTQGFRRGQRVNGTGATTQHLHLLIAPSPPTHTLSLSPPPYVSLRNPMSTKKHPPPPTAIHHNKCVTEWFLTLMCYERQVSQDRHQRWCVHYHPSSLQLRLRHRCYKTLICTIISLMVTIYKPYLCLKGSLLGFSHSLQALFLFAGYVGFLKCCSALIKTPT